MKKHEKLTNNSFIELHHCIFLMLCILLVIGFVSAETCFGIIAQGEPIDIPQIANASYCNITNIKYPNLTTAISNVEMTKDGVSFNYTFYNTSLNGIYIVDGVCDGEIWTCDFEVTNNGREKPEGIIIVVFIGFFLFLMFGSILSLLKMIGHWVDLEVDIIDASIGLSLYLVVFTFYYLSIQYLGDPTLESLLLIAVRVGAFTHVFIPMIAFGTSLIFNPFRKANK